MVELHPNDFVTWNLPYDFCRAAGSGDMDLSEVICQGEADVALSDASSTERVRVHLVSPNFFSSLAVRPYLGRLLTAEDERTGARNAVLSYNFWQKKFGGQSAVVGRSIVLGGYPFTIVGVSPDAFNGLSADTSPDLRVPAGTDRALVKPFAEMNPPARPLFAEIFGRLRNGVCFARANAEVDPLLHAAYQDAVDQIFPPAKGAAPGDKVINSHPRLESIVNGVSTLRPQFSHSLDVLMAGVALLLLMPAPISPGCCWLLRWRTPVPHYRRGHALGGNQATSPATTKPSSSPQVASSASTTPEPNTTTPSSRWPSHRSPKG